MSDAKHPVAFPLSGAGSAIEDARRETSGSEGMSLRDYFAAKAMQGMVGQLVADEAKETLDQLASDAFAIADAMLAERAK